MEREGGVVLPMTSQVFKQNRALLEHFCGQRKYFTAVCTLRALQAVDELLQYRMSFLPSMVEFMTWQPTSQKQRGGRGKAKGEEITAFLNYSNLTADTLRRVCFLLWDCAISCHFV